MRFTVIALSLLLSGCLATPQSQNVVIQPDINTSSPTLQYLGVGGWLIPWKGEGLLIAPSFSNPGLWDIPGVPPLRVQPDKQKIREGMPDARHVSMILVGHAHYDHLLDVPDIVENYAPRAQVYGDETAVHMLNYLLPSQSARYHNVLADIASVPDMHRPGDSGKWILSPGGHIRAKPLRSMHAGHVAGINLLPGIYDKPLTREPVTVWDWRLGTPVAWLIDLLDDKGEPVYRIHYQDSASTPPYGFPPVTETAKRVDIEILCAGSWEQVHGYPQALIKYNEPRMVLIGHWENFFANDPHDLRLIPGLKLDKLVKAVEDTPGIGSSMRKVMVPAPGARVPLPVPQNE